MGNKFRRCKKFLLIGLTAVILTLTLGGCATSPPKVTSNICEIFREKSDWYDDAAHMKKRWGVPIHVPMAMMYQESSFHDDALPPRDYILFGLIPWGRVSSAYGYSQAKTPTWKDYVRETGNSGADRDDFADAMDFMGWFIAKTYRLNGVSKWDAYAQYLNYHEGWGGYRHKTYLKKRWLMRVAKKVDLRSRKYARQLKSCEEEFQHGWLWNLFFG